MRVTIVTDTFAPVANGVATSTELLATKLGEIGNDVLIISPGISAKYGPRVEARGVPSCPLPAYPELRFALPSPKTWRRILKGKPVLLHAMTPGPLGVFGLIAARTMRIPIIGTFHTFFGNPHYLEHIRLNNSFGQWLAWRVMRAYYNRCDIITCPSRSAAEDMRRNGFVRDIQVIPNGVHLPRAGPVAKNHDVVYVGRIAYEKRIDVLVRAMRLVVQRVPDARLIIVGDGPQRRGVEQMIRAQGMEKHVVLKGVINRGVLLESKLFHARVFATASTTENQPMTVLEAEACGLVCVGVSAGGLPEVIQHGQTGLIVPPDDEAALAAAIALLLTDSREYLRLRRNALKVVRTYDIAVVAERFEALYRDICARCPGGMMSALKALAGTVPCSKNP